MGLTVYYDWKIKADLLSARRMIEKFRGMATKLPFDDVSDIYEQDAPEGKPAFLRYDHPARQGNLYLSRRRQEGDEEIVEVPALHAMFFHVRVQARKVHRSGWQVIRPWSCTVKTLFNGARMARNGSAFWDKATRLSFRRADVAIIPGIPSAKLNTPAIPSWEARQISSKPICRSLNFSTKLRLPA